MAISTTQTDVLSAVVTRLRAEVTELANESTCFVSDYPYPPPNVANDLFATVSPVDGRFDEAQQIGAGNESVIEETGIVVTVFSRVKLDRVGKTEFLLQDATRGLLPLKRKILKALASHRLVNDDDEELLVNYMHAMQGSAPRFDPDLKLGVMSLHFKTDFEWDLDT